MPARARVRWAQLRVGVMAIAAMIVLAILVWLLTSQKPFWEKTVPIYTYMNDAAGLATGAPVRLNGILIGSVARIELTKLQDPNKFVRIEMQVDSNYLKDIPVDSVAGMTSENVLGTKFINISRGQSQTTVQPGGVLPSEPSAELEDLMRRGFGVFDSTQAILNRIEKLIAQIEAGKGNVGKFIADEEFYNRLTATVREFQKIATAISSGKGTVGKLLYDDSLYNDVRRSVGRLDSIMASLQAGEGTAGKLLRDPSLYDDARHNVRELRQILEGVRSGKGTAGKLVTDDQLYNRVLAVADSLDKTLNRINTGEGTLGQLLVNRSLYESLNGLSSEMRALVKDIRANPSKFLRVKLALF